MKSYVINLDRSTDRLATFQQRNAHLRDIVRFSAIDGRLLDRNSLIKDGVITRDCSYGPGTLGCAPSHIDLWKKAVAQNQAVTVFEDDTIASFKLHDEFTRLISTVPKNWDFIAWGYNFDPCFAWVDFGFTKVTLRFYDRRFRANEQLKFQSNVFSSSLIKLVHSFGALAYSVSPRGAQSLLDYCLPLRNRLIEFPGADAVIDVAPGIDCVMSGAYSSMRAFICIPPLIIPDNVQNSDRKALDG